MLLLLNKQKDGPGLFFLHVCKQRKERTEIPGDHQAAIGQGCPPAGPLQRGANLQETEAHNPPRLAQRAWGVAENRGSPPLGAQI